MRYIFKFIVAFTFIFFSCSDQESSIDKTDVEINQKKVRIGDTITVTGKNLDIISHFAFNGTQAKSFLVSSEEMKVIVPIIYNEDFDLISYQNHQIIASTPMKLIGTFPLKSGLPSGTITGIKMINEDIVYITLGSKLYKTTTGGSDWDEIKDFNAIIAHMYFIDENEGWIGINDNFDYYLYYTNDGGASFTKIFDRGLSYSQILGIQFSTPTNGCLVSNVGEIYHTNDNLNFDLIYNFSTNPEGGNYSFNRFSLSHNHFIASGINYSKSKSVLLQGINNVFSYTILENDTASNTGIENIQLIEDTQAYMLYKGNAYFNSNILSGNWEDQGGNQEIRDFHFIDKSKGIGITETISQFHKSHVVYETYDGGKTWINEYSFRNYEYSTHIDFYNNTGFITGIDGKIWKHIFE
ncbi:hypothetical protein BN863_15930 [Formosa agariphila KMM 3901]|uniref:Uncharacterized protein n=1 Tax=Formosa agariphila (strain DSM 15362 / KCTC 12365 / LMG 23005 / KMM 3901 / M-2Alg 35-1) TaxID=1347342 RepID=T2KKP4_FORAG|nr:IPT/TIG domain-containing protein [Formosa agariphila]CDF79305.1 hypothetical protein BN863_15930 [Formosa agariphila KMM 3901]